MAKAPADKTPKREPHWLTQEQMARSCGISVQAFRAWNVEPVAKIGRHTFYAVETVLANRLARQAQRLEDQRPAAYAPTDVATSEREEKLRLTRAQAESQEIKNAQLRRELAPIGVIEWVVGKAGGQITAILDSIPMLLKKRNPKLTASDIELIRREIVKAQNAASQMTVDLDEYNEPDGDRTR